MTGVLIVEGVVVGFSLGGLWIVHRLGRLGPRIQRRPSRRPLRGDLWLWEQESRRDGSDL